MYKRILQRVEPLVRKEIHRVAPTAMARFNLSAMAPSSWKFGMGVGSAAMVTAGAWTAFHYPRNRWMASLTPLAKPAHDLPTFTKVPFPPKPRDFSVSKVMTCRDWVMVTAGMGCSVASACVTILIPKAAGSLIDAVRSATTPSDFLGSTIYLGSLFCAQSALNFLYYTFLAQSTESVALALKKTIFEKLLGADVSYFDAHRSGELLDCIDADVEELKQAAKHTITSGIRNAITFAGGAVQLYSISPSLSSILASIVPVVVGLGSLFGRYLRTLSLQATDAKAQSSALALEHIANLRTVRSFTNESLAVDRYGDALQNVEDIGWKRSLALGLWQGLTKLAVNGIVMLTIVSGGQKVVSGELSGGDLTTFMLYATGLQRSLGHLSVLMGELQKAVASYGRIRVWMNDTPSIPMHGGICLQKVRGELVFSNVTFSYPSRPLHKVFDQLTFVAQAGKVTALVGPSGAGKSSIAQLLLRFYDIEHGHLSIDGHDMKTLDPSCLRAHIGVVSQEPVLFSGTIAENILFGRPGASMEQVKTAARAANCESFIESLPEGYQTQVGERGKALSGGQKQRIAIARAVLRDPAILILDEATSALDTASEQLVQDALERLMKGRTTIVIAHRLSTIKEADHIVVLSSTQKRVAEQGTHDELMRKQGAYHWYVQKQSII